MLARFQKVFNRIHFIPAACWSVFIFALSGFNPAQLPQSNLFQVDKLGHIIMYAMLCMLIFMGFARYKQKRSIRMMYSFLIASVYGLLMEMVQWKFFPLRTFDLYDALANAMGCASCIAIVSFVSLCGKQKKQTPIDN